VRALGRTIAIVALLTGCQAMLELEPPALAPDAGAASATPDAAHAASPDAASCPPAPAGCTLFQCAATSGCYYACEVAATWSVAQSMCAQVGCLATVESTAEQECIAAATAPTNASPVWIGARQADGASEPGQGWGWACGASTYGNWGNWEPNDLAGDQDCGEMAAGGYWNDVSCGVQRRFVCKAP
jgi:hypothetical protein